MTIDELNELKNIIYELEPILTKLKIYSSNTHYKEQLEKKLQELNKNYKFFKSQIPTNNKPLQKIMNEFDSKINLFFNNYNVKNLLQNINDLKYFWPDLEIEISKLKSSSNIFEIPKEIPDNKFKKDLHDAIICYDNHCYAASLVMCRRSFEGSLIFAYLKITNGELKQNIICPNCKNNIGKKPLGIVWLHNWAMNEKIYPDKFKSLGILTADLGAGGAHPLEEFSDNPQIAKLTIHNTITLLDLIFTNKKLC